MIWLKEVACDVMLAGLVMMIVGVCWNTSWIRKVGIGAIAFGLLVLTSRFDLAWGGALAALYAYAPLWISVHRKTADQNVLTWFLWATLDGLIGLTLIIQHGNWLLPIAYAIASSITVAFLVYEKNSAEWTWFETAIVAMFVISLIIWKVSGIAMATVAASIAMVIGGLPQLKDAWRRPQMMPLFSYLLYLVGNGLSTAAGKNWSIPERFYPESATAYCLVIIAVVIARRARVQQ